MSAWSATEERERLRQLERENKELRRANEILKNGFLRGRARRSTSEMTRYIDAHKDELGVEPICKTLQSAPATYYAARSQLPSRRAVRDEVLKPEMTRVWDLPT